MNISRLISNGMKYKKLNHECLVQAYEDYKKTTGKRIIKAERMINNYSKYSSNAFVLMEHEIDNMMNQSIEQN